ncbi:MAG: fructose-6-phosphate aldolase [Bacteroidetes bacterium]|jgi:transaldolase|nr:fructose-6-phosphate aldolase [Bacteroidota bacterium]HCI70797.1 fructose-6-phosphate aldolase [Balneola sp.]|tara:strand:+ start:8627 stop:9286 length:660 start_codon:yes stop_codon:yes gene_type:complete
MKFFIDTANLEEIQEANDLGVLDGVTTNPSLCAKIGVRDFEGHIKKICDIVEGDVSAEVVSTTYNEMIEEGRKIAKIADNVVVKIPLIKDGIKAIKTFSEEGIKTNCTLCFSPTQALIAAKAGATYISPFMGRLDDISSDGMKLIEDIVQIYMNYGFETEVLAASIRHPMHVVECAKVGADVGTMPLNVIMGMLKHPLTDSGLARFLKDWEDLQASLNK